MTRLDPGSGHLPQKEYVFRTITEHAAIFVVTPFLQWYSKGFNVSICTPRSQIAAECAVRSLPTSEGVYHVKNAIADCRHVCAGAGRNSECRWAGDTDERADGRCHRW